MCDMCKCATPISKKIEFLNFGKELIIHLKRFKIIDAIKREKIFTDVKFPIDLELVQDNKTTVKFRLHAVLNHIGSLESGHYTAYCKDMVDDKWRQFDDNRVIEATKIQSEKAYVLFYEYVNEHS